MNYKIFPIQLGATQVDRSLYEYRATGGERVDAVFGCFLIQGNHHNILFDSGMPNQEEVHRYGFEFGYIEDAPYVIEELKKLEVSPEDIDIIILSHLHWDHSWNLGKFPNARIYVQKKELQHAVAPNLHERSAYGLIQGIPGCPCWVSYMNRIVPVDGDENIMDGIRVITTPGHTPGSQSVLVETAEGQYALVSDFSLTERCYRDCILTGIFTSADDWYYSYYKLRKINPKVITTHDPSSYQRTCLG